MIGMFNTESIYMKQKEGSLAGQTLNCPIIISESADNLDYQHSFARVYSGNQGISWHGTTVQITLSNSHKLLPIEMSAYDSQCISNISTETSTSLLKRPHSTLSPHKNLILNSPQPKKARRRRAGMENREPTCTYWQTRQTSEATSMPAPQTLEIQQIDRPVISMENFELSTEEENVLGKLHKICDKYIVLKLANEMNTNSLIGIQMYYCLSQNVPSPEITSIIYFKILDEKCDSKETLLIIINDLYTEFILSGKKSYVILAGDQATYERLHSIRSDYGSETKWLILFPGDWHFLKNYQEVLIKIYYDAGLSDLAKASGYLPRSIGTNFKRTHRFFLESWEALYRVLMAYFLHKEAPADFLLHVSALLKNFPQSAIQANAHRNLNEMIDTINEMCTDTIDFETYLNNEAKQNATLKFWMQFLLKDCLAYIALYLGIRSNNWDLRMAALKLMVPLFTAYDRPKYSKLIPLHIKEMFSVPADILTYLRGRFTISILGRACHSIGIDEGHEMCINKDCKQYITRPSKEHMNRTATFLPIRAKAIKNLEQQIYADSKAKKPDSQVTSLHTSDPESKKHESNVKAQVQKISKDSAVLPTCQSLSQPTSTCTCTTLNHLFNTQIVRPEQANDLSNFREIGLSTIKEHINYFILRTPSVRPPKRRKSLLTFTEKRTRQKKSSRVERERKIQLEVWKKRVAFAVTTGHQDNMSYQQCIELPRAIATSDGKLVKGAKANTTKVYERRYEHATPSMITTSLKDGWLPNAVFTEGMFLINITPWSAHNTMGDYADFLIKQHILPHYRNATTTEVHLLFDNPSSQQNSPKYFERLHRDEINKPIDGHCCGRFSADMTIPSKWRQDVLNCRQCKRQLICFLSDYFLKKIGQKLKSTQKFITAGGLQGDLGEKAMFVTNHTHSPWWTRH